MTAFILVLTMIVLRVSAQWIGKGQTVNVYKPFKVNYDEVIDVGFDEAADDAADDEINGKATLEEIALNTAKNFFKGMSSMFGFK